MASSSRSISIAVILALLAVVRAITTSSMLQGRQTSITPIPLTKISSFKPYTWYASTAYCEPVNTLAWDCGPNCQANPSFKPIASGGDGVVTQFCKPFPLPHSFRYNALNLRPVTK